MTLRQNTAEGQPSGTVLTAANSGGGSGSPFDAVTGGGVITFTDVQEMHGARGYLVNEAANQRFAQWNLTANPACAVRLYIMLTAVPTATQDLISLINTAGGACKIQVVANTGQVRAAHAGGTAITFATGMTVGQWYRLELRAVAGASTTTGTLAAAFYLGDSATPVNAAYSATTVNAGTTNWVTARVIKLTGSVALNAYFDDPAVDDGATAFIGPPLPTATAAATMASSSTLAAAGTSTAAAAAAMASGSTVTAGPVATTAAAVPVVSTSALSSGTAIAHPAAATLTSISTLAVAGTASTTVAATISSTSTVATTGQQTISPTLSPPVLVESATPGFQQTVNAGQSLVFAHTVNPGVTVLVVSVQASASSGLNTTATCYYADLPMTRVPGALSSTSTTAREASHYILVNPPVGTANVRVPARNSGTTYTLGATALSLLNASGDIGATAIAAAASTKTISGTTTSDPNALVITSAAVRSTTPAVSSGGTNHVNTVYGTNNAFNVNTQPGGPATITYTWATADQAALVSLPMLAVPSIVLASSSTLTVATPDTQTAGAVMASTSALTAGAATVVGVAAAVVSSSSVAVTSTVAHPTAAAVASTSVMTAGGAAHNTAAAVIASLSSVTVSGRVAHPVAVTLASTSQLEAAPAASVRTAAAAISGTSTVTATGRGTTTAAVLIVSQSTLLAAGDQAVPAAVTIVSTSDVAATGQQLVVGELAMVSASELAVAARQDALAELLMFSTSTMSVDGEDIPPVVTGPSVHFVGGPHIHRLALVGPTVGRPGATGPAVHRLAPTGPYIARTALAGPLMARLHLTGPEVR